MFVDMAGLAASGYVFRVMDNGGRTADRYTAVFCDGTYLAMSADPSHPQGVSQCGEFCDPGLLAEAEKEGEEVTLSLADLPERVARHVLERVNASFSDFLRELEGGGGNAVAARRVDAEPHGGGRDDAGLGIYGSAGRFFVRSEGDGTDGDPGPFPTLREAVIATLPQDYSLSGPEHHPAVRPDAPADPARAARVAALEERLAGEDRELTERWSMR